MKEDVLTLLEKARGKLRAAEHLLLAEAWDDVASRAYYAAFHAISALHLAQGNTFSSHAQTIGRFNRDFVHTDIFPRSFTEDLTRLFEDRQSGDYDLPGVISEDEARADLVSAEKIVNAVAAYLEQRSN